MPFPGPHTENRAAASCRAGQASLLSPGKPSRRCPGSPGMLLLLPFHLFTVQHRLRVSLPSQLQYGSKWQSYLRGFKSWAAKHLERSTSLGWLSNYSFCKPWREDRTRKSWKNTDWMAVFSLCYLHDLRDWQWNQGEREKWECRCKTSELVKKPRTW